MPYPHGLDGCQRFESFFVGLESLPFSAEEVAQIIHVSERHLSVLEGRGFISRSIINDRRRSSNFSMFNFYDVFRYKLVSNLCLSPFVNHEEVNDLLDELLDDFHLEIDKITSGFGMLSTIEFVKSIEIHFIDREALWRRFWLLEGDRINTFCAAHACVDIWIKTFDVARSSVSDFEFEWIFNLPTGSPREVVRLI